MNDPLDCLLRIAAKSRADSRIPQPPLGFDTRVLAAWRATIGEEEGAGWLAAFRPAIVMAGTAILVSVAFSWPSLSGLRETAAAPIAERTVVDSAIRLAFNP